MGGKGSRRKGATWERKLAKMLREIFGEEVRRGDQRRLGGAGPGEGCDVEGTPFFLEAKHQQVTNPRAAVRQARAVQAKGSDRRPIVAVCKDDKKPKGWKVGDPLEPPIAVMALEDWLSLVKDWARLKQASGEPLIINSPKKGSR